MISRRRFVENLGLSSGALFLKPIAESLFNRAQGAAVRTKRVVYLLSGNGMRRDWTFTPPEISLPSSGWDPVLPGKTSFTWPAMFKKLEPYRSRALLIDGLANQMPGAMHSTGYGALSCFTAAGGASNEELAAPGGITIDQHIAKGMNTAFKSVLVGVGPNKSVFASGRERPEAAITDPAQLHRALFGASASDTNGLAGGNRLRQKALFDVYRKDIARLTRGLATSERIPLDRYLEAIEGLDQQARLLAGLVCPAPSAPAAAAVVEDTLEQVVTFANMALICGITNVVGISAGTSKSHNHFPKYTRALRDAGLDPAERDWTYGHDEDSIVRQGMTAVYNYLSGIFVSMIKALEKVPEGDGNMFDNTVFIMLSCNAEAHHANHEGWPMLVVGNAGGALKADGRFIRYPHKGSSKEYRGLCDFHSTIATAVGVATESFGKGGSEPPKGVLSELLAV
ncbi:MAG: DUF1552 domain-containing protein [Deltaproteobacteria bacterium]|nr:DUF1552 domain-containing protein [Deltaproteobacteria bacterium]